MIKSMGIDNGEDSFIRITAISRNPGENSFDVDARVRENFPVTRCHHEYDCCGNFYAQRANWAILGELIIVSQQFNRNI